jgi:hypothetical protein
MVLLTWNTFGAPTILAKAEDNVAENIPAKISGFHADAITTILNKR